MANEFINFSTNGFTVTDEKRYNELYSLLQGSITDLSVVSGGETIHQFAGDGGISSETGNKEIDDDTIGYFMEELSKILPEDEAAIYSEIINTGFSNEAHSIIATKKNGVKSMDMDTLAQSMAEAMLEDNIYTLKNGYVISGTDALELIEEVELDNTKSIVMEQASDMNLNKKDFELVKTNLDAIAKACNNLYDSEAPSRTAKINDVLYKELDKLKSDRSKKKDSREY